jgi:hypothetical protein
MNFELVEIAWATHYFSGNSFFPVSVYLMIPSCL